MCVYVMFVLSCIAVFVAFDSTLEPTQQAAFDKSKHTAIVSAERASF